MHDDRVTHAAGPSTPSAQHADDEQALPGHGTSTAEADAPAHGHSHSGPLHLSKDEHRRVVLVLAALVVPLVLATLAGLALLWPSSSELVGSQSFTAPGTRTESATVTDLDVTACTQAAGALGTMSDGSLLKSAVCAEITTGDSAGVVMPVHVPAESLPAADVGDRLTVLYAPDAIAGGTPFVLVDYDRQVPVGALTIVYLVVVLAVAGRKGALSVIGLLLSSAVLLLFMIPALLEGGSPMPVTLTGSVAMMLVAVYVAHGISVRTTTALLGTLAGVVITVLLAMWGVGEANLTGAVGEEAMTLTALVPGLELRSLLTCGMVIAGLGVLNDVTITQASAVWELHAANPSLGRGRLFTSGMRIGRDHIASTVYTLAFAYAGTALPLILSASLIDRAVIDTMLSGEIAEELVRTLVSSIGLVLAIPATTLIAALLCRTERVGD